MVTITRNNVKRFCRICLDELHLLSKDALPKHVIENDDELKKCFRHTTDNSLRLHHIDSYPPAICEACYMKVKNFYKILETVVVAHEAIKLLVLELPKNYLPKVQMYCRMCVKKLLPTEDSAHVFATPNLRKWIFDCTGIEITKLGYDIHFPKFVCKDCYENLEKFADFRRLARQSLMHLNCLLAEKISREETLRRYLKSILPNKPKEDIPIPKNHVSPVSSDSSDLEDEKQLGDNIEDVVASTINLISGCTGQLKPSSTVFGSNSNTLNSELEDSTSPSKKNTFICKLCQKTFRSKILYDGHISRAHKGIRNPYTCVLCAKSYPYYNSLKKHIREMHPANNNAVAPLTPPKKKKLLSCLFCTKKFKLQEHLNNHIRLEHAALQPYKCNYCEKTFSQRSKCRVHEMGHASDNAFKCKYCNKRYFTYNLFKEHMQSHLTGSYSYKRSKNIFEEFLNYKSFDKCKDKQDSQELPGVSKSQHCHRKIKSKK